jgi:predicted nucleic acid-binding Zn ribbon protein
MSEALTTPEGRTEAARALSMSPGVECPACGGPLTGRQRACSGKCRAELSRRRHAEARQAEAQEVRIGLFVLRGMVDDLFRRVERRRTS